MKTTAEKLKSLANGYNATWLDDPLSERFIRMIIKIIEKSDVPCSIKIENDFITEITVGNETYPHRNYDF